LGGGQGRSKKQAEQGAARMAWEALAARDGQEAPPVDPPDIPPDPLPDDPPDEPSGGAGA